VGDGVDPMLPSPKSHNQTVIGADPIIVLFEKGVESGTHPPIIVVEKSTIGDVKTVMYADLLSTSLPDALETVKETVYVPGTM
jgi:hypothetical protein